METGSPHVVWCESTHVAVSGSIPSQHGALFQKYGINCQHLCKNQLVKGALDPAWDLYMRASSSMPQFDILCIPCHEHHQILQHDPCTMGFFCEPWWSHTWTCNLTLSESRNLVCSCRLRKEGLMLDCTAGLDILCFPSFFRKLMCLIFRGEAALLTFHLISALHEHSIHFCYISLVEIPSCVYFMSRRSDNYQEKLCVAFNYCGGRNSLFVVSFWKLGV